VSVTQNKPKYPMLSLLETGTLGDLGFFFGFGQAKGKVYGEGVGKVCRVHPRFRFLLDIFLRACYCYRLTAFDPNSERLNGGCSGS